MNNFLFKSGILYLLILMLLGSCKKNDEEIQSSIDIEQYYIAGKINVTQGPGLPFVLIPHSPTKAIFVEAGQKIEVDYTFINQKLNAKIGSFDFNCDIKNGSIENLTVNAKSIDGSVAALNKKQDSNLTLAGKRFDGAMINLNGGTVFSNYNFRFHTDTSAFNYSRGPSKGGYLLTPGICDILADGCFYDTQTETFGVILNDQLEVQTKLKNQSVLFSGKQQ